MTTVNLSLQVLPQMEGRDQELYAVVDEAIKVIQQSGVKYLVGPMETTMEGELDTLWEVVKKAQEACVKAGAGRVVSMVKIDYKPGGVTMEEKIQKYRGNGALEVKSPEALENDNRRKELLQIKP